MAIKWGILLHAIRNTLTVLGVFYTVSFLLTLHTGWLFLAVPFLVVFVWVFYQGEISFREIRLRKGLYQ